MTPPLRVLLLNQRDPGHPAAGGAEVHLREIFGRLASRGIAVTLISASFRGAPRRERQGGIAIHRVGPPPLYYLAAAWACARATRRGDCDVVVECLNKLPFYSPLYSRVPVLALCHHLFGSTAFRQLRWPAATVVWLSERLVPWLYKKRPFVAISESSRQDLVDRGIAEDCVRIIPCGVARPKIPIDLERPRLPRIAYLGRLEPYKGVDVLLRAMVPVLATLPNAELHVIGTGSARRSLERLARRLGIDERVVFHGFLPTATRDAILASTRVAVYPSAKEGWGLAVLECNAFGVPVIASDVPGLRDSVCDGRTGLLVPFGDSEELARRLVQVADDDELAGRLARASVEWSRRFDWDEAARQTAAVLEAAVARGDDGASRLESGSSS